MKAAEKIERFITPGTPPEGRERELLIILMEECAEVTKRASKALRFGLDEIEPGKAMTNSYRLGSEMGDLLHMIMTLREEGMVTARSIREGVESKKRQLARFMQFPLEG